jgi:hypothetical protein
MFGADKIASLIRLKEGMNIEHPNANRDINETSSVCSYRASSEECGSKFFKPHNKNNLRLLPDRSEYGSSFRWPISGRVV